MTEYVSRYDESRRQISKSSSSDVMTSKRVNDHHWSETRIIAQKNEGRDKSFTSINKELSRKNVPTMSDMLCKRGMDDKSNRPFLEDYKITRKLDIRPSDSSYTRKLSSDTTNSTIEMSTVVHYSKTHLDRDVQNCHTSTKNRDSTHKTVAHNHKKKLDFFCSDKRKTVENTHPPSYFSHVSEVRQLNGVSHDSHYRTTNHVPNGYCHSEINQSQSRDSSHVPIHGSEGNLLPAPLIRCTDLDKRSFAKYISPVQAQNHISPALNYVSHGNSKDGYSSPSSQKMVNPEESFSRPNSSAWGEEENSNEDKSLSVNFPNPVTSTPTPEKPRYPYSIEMREGMFKTVKEGPDHETLRIHIIENYGSGDLRDGGFSWGWSIEQRSSVLPSTRTSSASKDKSNSSANKDVHKSKRRLEFEKTSGSPTPKKSKTKVSDGRDPKSNREYSSKATAEDKSKSNPVAPPKYLSPHMKHNSMQGEKVTKSSKYSHTDVKKSPNFGRNLEFDKHAGTAVSPAEKRKSPIYVPSSEMIAHLSKTDCSGKNNVIDDSTMGFISSKKERSVVYSGRKSALEVQPLKAMCFESVKKNILGLKIGQNVPFELLLPALKLCSPSKLHKIEEHNRHISRRTDCLWKKFCESEFRDQKRLNGEAWKDVYWRARTLREAKLKNLAASISNGMSKTHPERQAKWVGVGTNNPEKRQRKNKVDEVRTKVEILRVEEIPKPEANGKGNSSSTTHKSSTKKRSGSESSSSNSPHSAQKPTSLPKNQVSKTSKKTLAPLMSKTKKMLNFVNRRR